MIDGISSEELVKLKNEKIDGKAIVQGGYNNVVSKGTATKINNVLSDIRKRDMAMSVSEEDYTLPTAIVSHLDSFYDENSIQAETIEGPYRRQALEIVR